MDAEPPTPRSPFQTASLARSDELERLANVLRGIIPRLETPFRRQCKTLPGEWDGGDDDMARVLESNTGE